MNRRSIVLMMIIMALMLLPGCCLVHDWEEATCSAPRTCKDCGKTDGSPLEHEYMAATCLNPMQCVNCGHFQGDPAGHVWAKATCLNPATCTVCGAVTGDVAEHSFIAATCISPKYCSICGYTEGDRIAHQWIEADFNSPRTCAVCGTTEGSARASFVGAFSDISYSLTKGNKQDYSTITGVDDRLSRGTVTIESYTKYPEDASHPYKEGYEWREVKAKFLMDKPSRVMWGYTDEYLGLNEYARTDYITYPDGTKEKVNATQSFHTEIDPTKITPVPTAADNQQSSQNSAPGTDASSSSAITAPQPTPTPTPAPTPESEPDKYVSYVTQAVQVPVRYEGLIFYVCNADYEMDHIIDDSFLYMKMD